MGMMAGMCGTVAAKDAKNALGSCDSPDLKRKVEGKQTVPRCSIPLRKFVRGR
jgi:hypothetical protein